MNIRGDSDFLSLRRVSNVKALSMFLPRILSFMLAAGIASSWLSALVVQQATLDLPQQLPKVWVATVAILCWMGSRPMAVAVVRCIG
jgi:branched-subunit amino acid transport protein